MKEFTTACFFAFFEGLGFCFFAPVRNRLTQMRRVVVEEAELTMGVRYRV
jgi:hypothetical protein